jgi:hypothetical protein
MRGTVGELEVHRVGVLGVAQRKQGAADEAAGNGLAGVGALGVHHDLRVRRRCAWGRNRRLPRCDP